MKNLFFIFIFFSNFILAFEKTNLGIDVYFKENHHLKLKDKKIALVINHTSINKDLKATLDVFLENAKDYQVVKLFSPEHGLNGSCLAGEKVGDSKKRNIEVLSLHGKNKRPTKEMLKDIDAVIYDIQEIGSRSYTYATTLFYIMEEAAKNNIEVIVLDRPNPINGIITDGPLNEEYRTFLGYINVPYCHGMTIGELALFFNSEYKINCKLNIVKMKGWKRSMSFEETKLHWIAPSPHIPEPSSAIFYATTGIMGELELVNIGIGYTLPFKIVGAPYIDAEKFSSYLNAQNLAGVKFLPFYFTPFYGHYKTLPCQGVMIVITDKMKYKPLATGFLLLGILKSLYPEKVKKILQNLSKEKIDYFNKVVGNSEMFDVLINEKYPAWKLIESQEAQLKKFQSIKKKYLLYEN